MAFDTRISIKEEQAIMKCLKDNNFDIEKDRLAILFEFTPAWGDFINVAINGNWIYDYDESEREDTDLTVSELNIDGYIIPLSIPEEKQELAIKSAQGFVEAEVEEEVELTGTSIRIEVENLKMSLHSCGKLIYQQELKKLDV